MLSYDFLMPAIKLEQAVRNYIPTNKSEEEVITIAPRTKIIDEHTGQVRYVRDTEYQQK